MLEKPRRWLRRGLLRVLTLGKLLCSLLVWRLGRRPRLRSVSEKLNALCVAVESVNGKVDALDEAVRRVSDGVQSLNFQVTEKQQKLEEEVAKFKEKQQKSPTSSTGSVGDGASNGTNGTMSLGRGSARLREGHCGQGAPYLRPKQLRTPKQGSRLCVMPPSESSLCEAMTVFSSTYCLCLLRGPLATCKLMDPYFRFIGLIGTFGFRDHFY